jgi:hypothetical protein
MLQTGLERTTPVYERAKTVHALDRAVTVIGVSLLAEQILRYPEGCTLWRFPVS